MKVLITPAIEKAACFWCRGRKKDCVNVEFSNGFLRGKPLCFECLERATRVQFGGDENVNGNANANAAGRKPDAPAGEPNTKS